MANEALLRDRLQNDVNFTCTELAMEKGTILKLSGARTVGPCSADNDVAIGVLMREKISGDGRTTVPVCLYGIFDCVFDGAVAQGADVVISGANILKQYATLDGEKGYTLGKMLETSTTAGGTFQVLVGG
jgi:hypothetical protein